MLDTSTPPPRFPSQLYPSTNSLLLSVRDLDEICCPQTEVYALLGASEKLQALDFSQYESDKKIRATFFDVRDAFNEFLLLQSDPRFQAVSLETHTGTNRSVRFPRGNLSLDLIYDKLLEFGDIEKIWFLPPADIVIDFFDSRAPLAIVRRLEQALRDVFPATT